MIVGASIWVVPSRLKTVGLGEYVDSCAVSSYSCPCSISLPWVVMISCSPSGLDTTDFSLSLIMVGKVTGLPSSSSPHSVQKV